MHPWLRIPDQTCSAMLPLPVHGMEPCWTACELELNEKPLELVKE